MDIKLDLSQEDIDNLAIICDRWEITPEDLMQEKIESELFEIEMIDRGEM